VGPVTRVTPVGLVVRVDPAARVGRVVPAGQVTVVDPEDMNRVVATTVGMAATAVTVATVGMAATAVTAATVGMAATAVTAAMAPAALVSQAVPVVRVGMILGDLEGRLRAPNPVVRVDPQRLGVPNPVGRVDPGNREATDLSQGRELMVQMPMRLHLTAARPHLTAAPPLPMPALPHLTPVDRRRDPTTRAVECQEATRVGAPRQEATQAEATQAVALRRAEATRRAGRPTAERNYLGGSIESRYAC
jgi:hypothetical protein